jgi:tRNA threonylcarbamoyladenosine biosynthesis protein TsaE
MSAAWERVSNSPRETLALGRALGRVLGAGDFLALTGPLGAGKTQLVKGIAAGLGVPDDEPIVSPTFVLVREYQGRIKLYHIDAYRLQGAEELAALGLDEMAAEPGAAIALEWADRAVEAVPPGSCWIELAHGGPRQRQIAVRWDERRLAEFAERAR